MGYNLLMVRLKWIALALIGVLVMWISTNESPFATFLLYLGIALVFGPLFLLFLVQIYFWIYNWIRHADPFYEKPVGSEKYWNPSAEELGKALADNLNKNVREEREAERRQSKNTA